MVTVAEIINLTAAYYGLTPQSIRGSQRFRKIARPRQVAMYLARQETRHSLPALGNIFRRDHSTIVHGIKCIKAMRGDEDIKKALEAISRGIMAKEAR